MTSLTSGRFQLPLNPTEGNTVDFVFRLSNNGVLFTPALTPVWIFGIKDADDPNGDFLIQVNSATAASGVFTFVVELASAELQTWLATATSQSYAAIQITDSANDIATGPLLCQIEPNQNDTGTTPTSANGTLNVAAGKTVTFPQSLTFPSALGTNGFQLTTDGAGALTWATAGISGITIGTTTANGTAGRVLYTDGALVQQYAISGTGSVAMTNTPTLVTPVLGDATGTSIVVSDGVSVSGANGYLEAGGVNGFIEAIGTNAYVSTRTIRLFNGSQNTILAQSAATTDKTATFPNVTGTVAVAATSATATQALFATATAGAPAYRGIATADIATALTTPGAIGGTTASTGAFTTLSGTSALTLGVAGPTGTAGTVVLKNATNAFTTTIVPSVVTASRQLNLPLITGTDTVAVLGLAQTFSGNNTFSGTVSCQSTLGVSGATTCSSTLAVTGATTLTGQLTLGGGADLLASAALTTYNDTSSNIGFGSNQPSLNSPTSPDWIRILVNGINYYMPIWNAAPPP